MIPEFIVIHHSLTKDSGTVSWSAIREFHKTDPLHLWNDIGYHWGLELVNKEYEIILGRNPNLVGSHCKEAGMNRKSEGFVIIGNFDTIPPVEAIFKKTIPFLKWLMEIYMIQASKVIGHWEAGLMDGFDRKKGQYKSCPGFAFDMDNLRKRLSVLVVILFTIFGIQAQPVASPTSATAPVGAPRIIEYFRSQEVFKFYHQRLQDAVNLRIELLHSIGIAKREGVLGDIALRRLEQRGDQAKIAIDKAINKLDQYLLIQYPSTADKRAVLWEIAAMQQAMLTLQEELIKEELIK